MYLHTRKIKSQKYSLPLQTVMHWLTEAPNSSGEPLEKSQYCKGGVNHVSSWQLVALPSVFLSRTLIGNTGCLHLILTGQLHLTPDSDSWRHQTRDWLPDRPVGAVCVQRLCNYTVTVASDIKTLRVYYSMVHIFFKNCINFTFNSNSTYDKYTLKYMYLQVQFVVKAAFHHRLF